MLEPAERLIAVLVASALWFPAAAAAHASPPMRDDPTPLWRPTLPMQPQGFRFTDAFADGVAYVMRTNQDGESLMKSTDHGATWSPATLPFQTRGSGRMEFATSSIGYASDGVGVFRTETGTAQWGDIPGPVPEDGSQGSFSIDAITVDRADSIVAAGGTLDSSRDPCADPRKTERAALATTADRGATWRVVHLGFPGTVYRMAFRDPNEGVALASRVNWTPSGSCGWGGTGVISDAVYHTADGGLTWSEVMRCTGACSAVGFFGPGGFVVGGTDGSLSRTTDGGRSFSVTRLDQLTPMPLGTTIRWVEGVAFADERVGYASTSGRGVFRTDDGGETWVREASIQDVDGLAIGDLAVADAEHAIVAGRNAVSTRGTV